MKWLLIFFCAWAPIIGFANDLGTDINPIKCDNPEGESWYLSRLRLPPGEKTTWKRLGSGAVAHDKHTGDFYKAGSGRNLAMCMYHPQYVEIMAPEGFRLLFEWSDDYEYINGKLHKWGEASSFSGHIVEIEKGVKTEVEIVSGMIRGTLKRWFPGGALMLEIEYGESNHPHGMKTRYHEDGAVLVKYTFREGILHGPFEYHPRKEGEEDQQGTYEEGVRKLTDKSLKKE